MFWRLFFTYLLFVVVSVGLIGAIVLRRAGGGAIVVGLAGDVVAAAFGIIVLALVPSYLIARRLTRPLSDLARDADRLAEGELDHLVPADAGGEFAALARALNEMGGRLAITFDQIARDREQLRTILSGMVEGVVAFDNDERVLFANDRGAALLEFDETAVGRKLWEATRQRGVQEIADRALRGSGPYRQELDWNGTGAKNLAIYAARLPGPNSPGAVLVLHDITELRRLERLRQDFVANVSHELKTPLAVIQSNIEALQDGAADDPTTRGPFLDRVKLEADRLDELIQDLLKLAKIESGEQPLDLGPMALDAAIAECLERQATRAEAKSMRVFEVPPTDAPRNVTALADVDAVGHVLDNLVDNAIKYSPSGGKIVIRWGAFEGQVFVEVEDTGHGISEADLPRVFERFFRADRARQRTGGTGLGLAIVKHLVQAMNGQVTVASRLGTGSTFKIVLPRSG